MKTGQSLTEMERKINRFVDEEWSPAFMSIFANETIPFSSMDEEQLAEWKRIADETIEAKRKSLMPFKPNGEK